LPRERVQTTKSTGVNRSPIQFTFGGPCARNEASGFFAPDQIGSRIQALSAIAWTGVNVPGNAKGRDRCDTFAPALFHRVFHWCF